MPQLAGSKCVICGERIGDPSDAGFCETCGNPRHERCLEAFTPEETAQKCSRCGGDPRQTPRDAVRSLFDPRPLLVIVGVLVAALAVYWFLPDDASFANALGPTAATKKKFRQDPNLLAGSDPVVDIETSEGSIRVRLFPEKAPITVENFLYLVAQKFYDGLTVHRVTKHFLIQMGDPLGDGTGGREDKGLPAKKIKDEFNPELRHDKEGILSMANNPTRPNSGDCQFFITLIPVPHLDDKHSVFGEVIGGIEVVRKIALRPADQNEKPFNPPKILSIRTIKPD